MDVHATSAGNKNVKKTKNKIFLYKYKIQNSTGFSWNWKLFNVYISFKLQHLHDDKRHQIKVFFWPFGFLPHLLLNTGKLLGAFFGPLKKLGFCIKMLGTNSTNISQMVVKLGVICHDKNYQKKTNPRKLGKKNPAGLGISTNYANSLKKGGKILTGCDRDLSCDGEFTWPLGSLSHSTHVWYAYLYIYHRNQTNVG